jgi:molybdenum ABC transporter molybdate-binding protein
MFARLSPALVAFGASVLLLAGLIGSLYWISLPPADEPLEVFCAAALLVPMEAIGKDYEAEYGQRVLLHGGNSQGILSRLELTQRGDLFLPADDSYVHSAEEKKLLADVSDIASMQAVVIVSPKLDREIKTWADFVAPGIKIGLANAEAAAIGKLTKERLQARGLWTQVEARQPTSLGTVTEVGNSVALGTSDIGITWDALALDLQKKNPNLKIVRLKELGDVTARVKIAVVKFSAQPANARRFVSYACAKDKGLAHLQKFGYAAPVEPPQVKDPPSSKDSRPELTVYAGAMLRPAVEESLADFEKRENVRINRVYNGCGILVGQMEIGAVPDIYFACDTTFMAKVETKFGKPVNVSNNQLMIIVPKGNPKKISKLTDLGQPGLRVGVGHEHQCAMGALTRETFIRTGLYAQVMKNVVQQSPSGDVLVNQMRVAGGTALDVVIAYRSNLIPNTDMLEGVPIEGIPCATPSQPIAVSKGSAHPELSKRLMEFLQTAESRQRFEKLGFGWEIVEK